MQHKALLGKQESQESIQECQNQPKIPKIPELFSLRGQYDLNKGHLVGSTCWDGYYQNDVI